VAGVVVVEVVLGMDSDEVVARLDILNLYARYCHAFDSGDGESFADCFTADGVTDISSFPRVQRRAGGAAAAFMNADMTIRGREQLAMAASRGDPGGLSLHHCTTNVYIKSVTGDRAESAAYFVVFSADGGVVEHYGVYEDRLCRSEDGNWRIAERVDRCIYDRPGG
jgi:hypothetical protein